MSETEPTEPTEPTPETPEKEVDWKAEAEKWKALSRKNEDNAKANAEKASRLDEIEEASKSELEKAQARAEAAEMAAQEATQKALRAEIASAKGVPAHLLTGATKEELEAAADALLEFRGQKPTATSSEPQGKRGEPVGEDNAPDTNALIRAAFRK